MRGRLKSACAASAASAPMNVVARRGLFGLLLSLFILLLRQSAELAIVPVFVTLSAFSCDREFDSYVNHLPFLSTRIQHCCLEMLSRPLTWLSEHLRALSGLPVIVQSSAVRVYQPTFRSCLPALRHCLPALHRCLEMLSRPLSWLSEHLRALSGLPVIVQSSAVRVYQPTFRSCLPALRHCLPALHRCLEMLSRPLSWLSNAFTRSLWTAGDRAFVCSSCLPALDF